MKTRVQIRKAYPEDLMNVVELYDAVCEYLETHENYPGWRKGIYPTVVDAKCGIQDDALYVAQTKDHIIGSVILRHKPPKGYQNVQWLTANAYSHIYVVYTLAVHPEYRHCGVGKQLLDFAEEMAKQQHCHSLRLDVVKGNLPAERLYQKCGYQFVGTVSLGYEEYGLPWYSLYEKVL